MKLIDEYEVGESSGCVRLVVGGDQVIVLSPERARLLASTLEEYADVADLDSEEQKADRIGAVETTEPGGADR